MDDQRRPGELTDADRETVRKAVAKMPPLTDEQIDDLCAVLLNAKKKQRRQALRESREEEIDQ